TPLPMPIPRIPNGPPAPPGPPRPSMRVWSTAVVDRLPAAVAAPVLIVDEPLDVFVAVFPSWRPMPISPALTVLLLLATLVELLPTPLLPPVVADAEPELVTPEAWSG